MSLAWGDISLGGYALIGNSVVVNIRVTPNQTLNAAATYEISGFPIPANSTANSIAAMCSLASLARTVYMSTLGKLTFIPDQQIASNNVFLLSCCYIKQ